MWRVLATAAVLGAQPAAATIISGTVTGALQTVSLAGQAPYQPLSSTGDFIRIDPVPAAFVIGADTFQDANVRGFDERQGFVLDRVLRLNSGGNLAPGTRVSSHLVVFDAPSLMSATGTVTFRSRVLGLIWSNGRLAQSDYLGHPQLIYGLPKARGIETAMDSARFAGRTVHFRFVTNSPGDSIRVITAAVPEPASWALLVAGFGLVGAALRRRPGLYPAG